MKPLQIDFSSRSRLFVFNSSDPMQVAYAILLVLGAIVLVAGVGMALRLNSQSTQLAQSIDNIESVQRARDESSTQTSQLSTDDVEEVNASVTRLNYPWLDFFSSLEGHTILGVSLVSVDAGVGRQSTKIVIEAPGVDEALAYIQSLKLEPMLAGVTLIKQESVVATGSNAPAMRFTLDVPSAMVPAARVAPSRGSS